MGVKKATIAVEGRAEQLVDPDRAEVSFSIRATGPSRSGALAGAAERATVARAVLDELHAPRVAALGKVSVQPWERWDEATRQHVGLGYVATIAGRVDIDADPIAVADLVEALTDRAGAEVERLTWSVDDAHPVHDEVRADAARDARRRAQAYVTGLGVELGEVVTMRETGASYVPHIGTVDALVSASSLPAGGLPLDAEPQLVDAELTVVFRLR